MRKDDFKMLELKKITKEYQTGEFKQTALDNVTVNFRNNEFVSILGPSGSGKTTMLNIIKIWHFVQKKGIFSSVVYSQEYIFANGYERRIRPSFYRNPNFIFGT